MQDGCVTPGSHKLLRFDFLSYNAGNADLVIGSPAARPDLFVWSAGHGHYHLKDFNESLLFNSSGALATVGYKQAFCAIDIERISPTASTSAKFNDCNSDQGISAGWADVYSSFLACQFTVLDGVPDGDYTLQSTTNAQHRVGEDCFGDNTIWTGLRLSGNTVQLIDAPFIPEDRSECPGDGPNPRTIGGFTFEAAETQTTTVTTRHGITGLDIGRRTTVRLPKPAAVVAVGLAHFGEPPSLAANSGERTVAKIAADERPRHIENLRLVGRAIDSVTVASPDGEALINYVPTQPETTGRRRAKSRK